MIALHVLTTKFRTKVSVPIHTDTNETFRSERNKNDITLKMSQYRTDNIEVVCHIKHNLLGDALREDGGLGDIQTCIFFEYTI
jgi:hypothetical protein